MIVAVAKHSLIRSPERNSEWRWVSTSYSSEVVACRQPGSYGQLPLLSTAIKNNLFPDTVPEDAPSNERVPKF